MKKIILVFMLACSLLSCTRMMTKLAVNLRKEAKPTYYSNGSRTLAYIPMMHIQKPEFYAGVKHKVDSLRGEGYVIYYENLTMRAGMDSTTNDLIRRKYRKITGYHLSDYLNKDNKSVKKFQVKGLVSQGFENTGVNPKIDVKADIYLDSLIHRFEKSRGEVRLNECDWTTPLYEKYNCGKINEDDLNFLIFGLRNQNLYDMLMKDTSDKIAIVYGGQHEYALRRMLQAADSTWQYHRPVYPAK